LVATPPALVAAARSTNAVTVPQSSTQPTLLGLTGSEYWGEANSSISGQFPTSSRLVLSSFKDQRSSTLTTVVSF